MCINPLRGWKNPKTGYVVKVTKSNVVGIFYDTKDCKYYSIYDDNDLNSLSIIEYIDIPCRSCLDCYNQSRREWIARAVAEAQCHDKMLFATFTYSDDSIPTVEHIDIDTGEIFKKQTLRYRDFQLFLKRLRKEFKGVTIRYMVCGEYGSHTFRPHYHAIIYGLSLSDIPDALPHSKSKTGDFLYSSEYLDNIWNLGYTLIADANTSTIAYVAGYVAKKADTMEGKFFYDYFNIARPFIRGSLKPALGADWLEKNIDNYSSIYDYRSVPTCDEPVKIFLTSNWKLKYKNKLLQNSSFNDIVNYEDELVDRRVNLLDDYFLHLDTDMSKEDYNNSLNDNLRNSSKRKRGVY